VPGRGLSALYPHLQGLPDIDYPFHDKVIVVRKLNLCLGRKKDYFMQRR